MYRDNKIDSDSDKDDHTDVLRKDRKRLCHGRAVLGTVVRTKQENPTRKGRNKTFKLKCLNPSCNGEHPVKRCAKTPPGASK